MTTPILVKPTIWSIASDLNAIHTSLRITYEMMIDQLGDTVLTDIVGVTCTHERLFLLLELIPDKLKEMERLDNALLSIGRETKAASQP